MKKALSILMVVVMILSVINTVAYAADAEPFELGFSTGSAGDKLPKNSGSAYYTISGADNQGWAAYESFGGEICAALTDNSVGESVTLHVPFNSFSKGTVSVETDVCSSLVKSGLDIVKVLDSDGNIAAKCVVNNGKLALFTGVGEYKSYPTDVFQSGAKLQKIKFVFDFSSKCVKMSVDGSSVQADFKAENISEVTFATREKDYGNKYYVSGVKVFEGDETDGVVSDKPTLYLIGDSTGSPYTSSDYSGNGGNYDVPRNGFGMSFDRYFDTDKINLVNYAVSGISSKSFTSNKNFEAMAASRKAGDFLIIAFGHNDEKDSDEARFTNASMGADGTDTEGQFANSLYQNYIKPARDAGVTVILATPIIRRSRVSDVVTGSDKHDLTEKGFGDYSQTIRDLADKLDLPYIDNTQMTYNEYISLGRGPADGSEGYGAYHAQYSDEYMTTKEYFDNNGNLDENYRIDNTHLNAYGARTVGYFMAQAISGAKTALSGGEFLPVYKDNSKGDLKKLGAYLKTYTDPRIEDRSEDLIDIEDSEGFSVYLDTETTLHDTLGETFDIYLKVKDNKGISDIGYTLSYDTDILELVSPDVDGSEGTVYSEGKTDSDTELSDGELAVYTFKVVGGGDTDVKLDVKKLSYNGTDYKPGEDFRTGSLSIVCDFNPEESNS